MKEIHADIIIVGAGLSGIGAACHLARKNPEKAYLILESREELGGTWSLFKYPGIRSDSDMYTFGYSFKTWDAAKSFADAPSILKYLNEAVDEYNVRDKIVYSQRAISYNFDSQAKHWKITTRNTKTGEETQYTSNFIFSCSGYYTYDKGYTPTFKGQEDFKGAILHPQKWPEGANLNDKKVVVIGSGATAVTIVPEIAEITEHVTMVQRSPTYIGALPNKDIIAGFIKKIFPKKTAHKLVRIKNVILDMMFFQFCRRFPNAAKKFIIKGAKKALGDYPVDPHFTPDYNPWTQRFCLAPDGDFFEVIKQGKASVETAHIDQFTENGIQLQSGKHIEADTIITATGLNILPFGGVKISIDNELFDIAKSFVYKGVMLSGLPNFFVFVGYTNASWTLKSDLTSEYISRALNFIDKNNYQTLEATVVDNDLKPEPLLNLNSGYILRSANALPSQGHRAPWRVYQNYVLDYKMLRVDKVNDKYIVFS
ncbi:NAD(P)/FAD-dependent oxidoreductase [Flavobacteriaceae sp. LMIT009]